MQEKISVLELQLASAGGDRSSLPIEQCGSEEYIDELRKKIQLQVIAKTSSFQIGHLYAIVHEDFRC